MIGLIPGAIQQYPRRHPVERTEQVAPYLISSPTCGHSPVTVDEHLPFRVLRPAVKGRLPWLLDCSGLSLDPLGDGVANSALRPIGFVRHADGLPARVTWLALPESAGPGDDGLGQRDALFGAPAAYSTHTALFRR